MRLLPFVVTLLASACATPHGGPIEPAPADQALVVIYRSAQFTGTDIEAPFTVDGERLFELGPGERAELLLAPGSHVLETRKVGGMQTSAPGKTEIKVQAGRSYFIEWSAMASSVGADYMAFSGAFRRVSTDEGLREAEKTRRVFSSR